MTLCHPALAATGVAEAHSVWSASPSFEACSVSVVFLVMFRHQDVRSQWSHKKAGHGLNVKMMLQASKRLVTNAALGYNNFPYCLFEMFVDMRTDYETHENLIEESNPATF